MNIPCPEGLSGGPLFSTREAATPAEMQALALVTENLEAKTEVTDYEDITTDPKTGRVNHVIYRRLINYGIALVLAAVDDWIGEHVARITEEESRLGF